jgi:hypothetical protein
LRIGTSSIIGLTGDPDGIMVEISEANPVPTLLTEFEQALSCGVVGTKSNENLSPLIGIFWVSDCKMTI